MNTKWLKRRYSAQTWIVPHGILDNLEIRALIEEYSLTGTNGKGSCCDGHGLCEGMDCSKGHSLHRTWTVRERIQLDGVPLEEEPFWQAHR